MERRAALIEGYSRSAPMYDQTAGMTYLGALWKLLPGCGWGPPRPSWTSAAAPGINILEAARVLAPLPPTGGRRPGPWHGGRGAPQGVAAGVPATFMVGDAERLELEDASFDLVICNSVYHWFPDRQRAIAELARVLRPGGQVLVNCVADPGFHEWIRVVDEVWTRLFTQPRSWLPPLPTPGELMAHVRGGGPRPRAPGVRGGPRARAGRGRVPAHHDRHRSDLDRGGPAGQRARHDDGDDRGASGGAAGGFVVTSAGVATVSRKPAAA